MPRLDNSIDIKAPVDKVFGYIVDATAHPEWVKWTKRAEVTSIEHKGIGATTAEVMQVGPKKEPDLPHVPLLTDLARDDVQRQMFAFVTAPTTLERPFAGPPS